MHGNVHNAHVLHIFVHIALYNILCLHNNGSPHALCTESFDLQMARMRCAYFLGMLWEHVRLSAIYTIG